MPKIICKKLTAIARDAKRDAVEKALRRFDNNRVAVAAYFGITRQAIGQIMARK